ncbi:MAG: FAD-dependent oxidoreductase [Myxococcota bacterium]
MPPPRHVLIVGAGLAGLSCASRLARAGCRVTVIDGAERLGGRHAGGRVDGYDLEPSPFLVTAGQQRLLAWIDALGLRDELLPVKPVATAFCDEGGAREIALRSWRDVAKIPGVQRWHALRLIRLPRLLSRYGAALDLGAAEAAEQYDDRSLADFARLYFGSSVLERWMGPVGCGTTLGDPHEVSRLQFLQQLACDGFAMPGRLRGPLSDLFERAAEDLEVVLGCPVRSIEPGQDGGFRAVTVEGRSLVGDALVLATPAPLAARLSAPVLTTPELRYLRGVRYAPALTVSAALVRPLVNRTRHLWVSTESGSPLGAVLVEPGERGGRAPSDGGVATLVASGRFAANHLETPDETLEKELLVEVERLWPGLARSVEFTRVFRYRFGAPRFDVGAYRELARFRRVQRDRRATGRRLAFAGDYSVAPTPEGAVRSGEQAADSLLREETAG